MIQERGASAKRTRADARNGLMSSSSQEPSALGKSAALFSLGSEESGNSNLGRSLLEGNKDHLLTRQEHQVGSLNNCISELHNMLLLKDWNYKTLNTDTLNLDEDKYVYKKNYL